MDMRLFSCMNRRYLTGRDVVSVTLKDIDITLVAKQC